MAVVLLHVLLPVLMGPALASNLAATSGAAWWWPGALALMFGSAAVYTGERVLVRGSRFEIREASVLLAVCALALSLLAVVVLRHQYRLLQPVAYLGLMALSYPALVRIPGCKAVIVSLGWWFGCTLLPVDASAVPWHLLAHPTSWAVAVLVVAGTLLCDLKDLDADRLVGIPSLPVRWGPDRTRYLAAALAAASAVPVWWGDAWGLLPSAFLLVVLAFRPALLLRPLWGPIAIDAALCAAVLVPLATVLLTVAG